MVGLNRFRLDEEDAYEPLRVDPQIEADQRERLARLRAERDSAAVDRALDDLRAAAKGTDNVLPPMRDRAGRPGHRRRGLPRPARRVGDLRPARHLLSRRPTRPAESQLPD